VGLRAALAQGANIAALLGRQAHAGLLVGATVPLVRRAPLSDLGKTRRSLAAALEDVLRERARGGSGGPLASRPYLVAWPASMHLHLVLLNEERMPGLVVDLKTAPGEERHAERVLQTLRHAGLPILDPHTFPPLPLPPEDWHYLLWTSQVLVLAGRDSKGEARKLLFEPLRFDLAWYECVRTSRSGGLALFIGDFRLGIHHDASAAVGAALDGGRMLGCALRGMCAS
jgi:hypothetical protein